MHQMTIERFATQNNSEIYLIDCFLQYGNILTNDIWFLESKPELKIKIKSPLFIKKDHYNGMIHFTIFKPDFNLESIPKNSIWIK